MRRSVIAGSLLAAGVCGQAAPLSTPDSNRDQPAPVFADGDLAPRGGGDDVHSKTSFLLKAITAFRGNGGTGVSATRGPAVRQADLQQHVSNFISDLFASWSSSNGQTPQVLKGLYEDAVTYYGEVISREAVLDDKRRFAERWPQRSYAIRPGTLVVQCGDRSLRCTVSGITDWAAANGAKRSTGAAHFYYAVCAGEGGLLKIAEETSEIVHGPIISSHGATRPPRAASKTACAAAEMSRENVVCRN